MNALTRSDVVIEVGHVEEHVRSLNADRIPQGAPLGEWVPPSEAVQPYALDNGTFETSSAARASSRSAESPPKR
jgi:hypothetical protein